MALLGETMSEATRQMDAQIAAIRADLETLKALIDTLMRLVEEMQQARRPRGWLARLFCR